MIRTTAATIVLLSTLAPQVALWRKPYRCV
jgi:hypothetical protein